jgi:peptidoglycan/xylan/chitin deacetylase (PgdA/CDA1 family)
MAEYCKNHPHREAKRKCFYCKVPVCPSCQKNLDHHFFCSNECHQQWKSEEYMREVRKKAQEEGNEIVSARDIVSVREKGEKTVSGGKKRDRREAFSFFSSRNGLPLSIIFSQVLASATAIAVLVFVYLIADKMIDAGMTFHQPTDLVALAAPELVVEIEKGKGVKASGMSAGAEFAVLIIDGEILQKAIVADGEFEFESFKPYEGAAFLQVKVINAVGKVSFSEGKSLLPFFGSKPVDSEYSPQALPEITPEIEKKAVVKRKIKYVQSYERGKKGHSLVSLTFDGGADCNVASDILNTLAAKSIHSTIFLTGKFIKKFPELTRRILAEGHEVGNHTYRHPHLTSFATNRRHDTLPGVTREFVIEQLTRTEQVFKQVTGRDMVNYWRAPYGEMNNEIRSWALAAGYKHVGWTRDWESRESLDTLDWVADPSSRLFYSSSEIVNRIVNFNGSGPDGGIVLMHLGTQRTQDKVSGKLGDMIDGLRAKGLAIVPISKLLNPAAPG